MDYATLTKLIQEYCENKEDTFVANIPEFVRLAERRTYQRVPPLTMHKEVTGFVSSGNRYLTMPTDWLSTDEIAIIMPTTGEYRHLLQKETAYIREAYPIPMQLGTPQYYAVWDENTLLLGPTPDSNYATDLLYVGYPESIVTAGTTWLSEYFEFVLLYGCIREGYLYMKGEADIIQEYEKKYEEAMVLLENHVNVRTPSDTYRPPAAVRAGG